MHRFQAARWPVSLLLAAIPVFLLGCPDRVGTGAISNFTYEVVQTFPHDSSAFTQGLVCDEGTLYEGTGLFGQSSLREVDLLTGQLQRIRTLGSEFFGEGIATFGDTILQLTWRSNVGFIYDKATFNLLGEFTYPTEGWGITHNGVLLIMSDGTSTIRFRDPETFEEVDAIEVFDAAGPVQRLNELEYIDGRIYANVWLTDFIAVIDPETGEVESWIDLTGLRPEETLGDSNAVLNGIAYDAEGDRLFVTGKRWPSIFEIELVPVDEESMALN